MGSENIVGKESTDQNNPTELVDNIIIQLNFTETTTSFYYEILPSVWDPYVTLGLFVNSSDSVDVGIKIYKDTFGAELIGESNDGSAGENEGYILQPYSEPQLNGIEYKINVSSLFGSGEASLYFRKYDKNDVLPQTDEGSSDRGEINVDKFDLMPLNYSSGAEIQLNIKNVQYDNENDFRYHLYLFANNTSLNTASHKFHNITKANFTINQFDILEYKVNLNLNPIQSELQGLVLAVIGYNYTTAHKLRVGSEMTAPLVGQSVPEVIGDNKDYYINASKTNTFAFEFTIDVNAIKFYSDDISFTYRIGFDNSTMLSNHRNQVDINQTKSHMIQNFGYNTEDHPNFYDPGKFYWALIEVDPNGSGYVSIQVTSQDKITEISGSDSDTIELAEDQTIVKILKIESSSPSKSVIWIDPSSTLDADLLFFRDSGNQSVSNSSLATGLGIRETTGNIETAEQDFYVLVLYAKSGNGNLNIHYYRDDDIVKPSVNFTPKSEINYTDNLDLNIQTDDTLGIRYVKFYYRMVGATQWSELYWTSSQEMKLSYGEWEYKFEVLDLANNKVVKDNNSNNFKLDVLDNIGPEISFDVISIEPQRRSNVSAIISDSGSGVDLAILELTNSTHQTNLTMTRSGGDLFQVDIPKQKFNESLNFTIYAKDSSSNWNKSPVYQFSVEPVEFNISAVVAPTKAEIAEQIEVSIDLTSNDNITEVSLQYQYTDQESIITVNSTESNGNKFAFLLSLDRVGKIQLWFIILTESGIRKLQGNYSIHITAANSDTNSDETNSTDVGDTIPNSDDIPENPDEEGSPIVLIAILSSGAAISGVLVYGYRSGKLENLINRIRSEDKEIDTNEEE